jgi:uncharacterized membrane protein YebE (DUF533 family)
MLYNIIIIALALTIPLVAYKAFQSGYNTALHVDKGAPIPTAHPPTKARTQPETDAQRKARLLQANIDNYGTKKPQREVK